MLPLRRLARALAGVALAALALSGGAAAAGQADPPFPRTLGLFLTQDRLPGASSSCTPGTAAPLDPSVLGRFDALVIDIEWSNTARTSCYSPSAFAQIRDWVSANSGGRGITILPYVNPVDRPGSLGSTGYYQYRYDLWGCRNAVTFGTCAFPKNWLAHTAKGQTYSEFNGTWMTNLTDAPQPGTMPAGTTSAPGSYAAFEDYFGTWVGGRWNDPLRPWSAVWDGVYLDVWGNRIWNNTSPWDPYWGGPLDQGRKSSFATSVIYADPAAGSGPSTPAGLWQRGIAAGNARIQAAAGTLPILVANNTQSATTAPGENGRLWESFADPALGRVWSSDVPGYVDASGPNPLGYGTRTNSGTTFLTAVDGGFPAPAKLIASDYQRARFDLASSLLGNGYWGASTSGYDAPLYTDEMDGGTLHRRGYLGAAADPRPSWAELSAAYVAPGGAGYTGEGRYANGVYRRDFDGGIALVNPSSGAQTVTLERTYYRLRGLQAPSVNSGAPATSVTLAKNDALILVTSAPPAS